MNGFYRTIPHGNGRASLEWVPAAKPDPVALEKARLFPNGIPLRGTLTLEQQAWLSRRS